MAYLVFWCMVHYSRLFHFELISGFDSFDQLTLLEITSRARHSAKGPGGGPSAIAATTSDQG